MVLQASLLHEFINKKKFLILPTVSYQPDKVRMRKPS
jgi:hypothetical protein